MLTTTRRRLLKRYGFPLFLFAIGGPGSAGPSDSELKEKIRKKRCRILIIDDEPDFRLSLRFKLEEIFAAVVEDVNSGSTAIAAVKSGKRYDLILTDLIMPGKNGMEIFQELQQIDPGLRVVIMSAFTHTEEWNKAAELGATVVEKPISNSFLLQILNEI